MNLSNTLNKKMREEIKPQFRLHCPITGEQTKKLATNNIITPTGQIIWWHCAACGGWHLDLKYNPN